MPRAIYLRSPDGIHWKCDPGLSYDQTVTRYADGTTTTWYKLERPHVIQDDYGRATHLSLAVMDVAKREDLGGDNHSSKNIILPLVVHKRLTLLNSSAITSETESIRVLIRTEEDFDAASDLKLESLRFGASEEVNYGRGCGLRGVENHDKGVILEFNASGHGFTQESFAGKLLGETKKGELVIGFTKLP